VDLCLSTEEAGDDGGDGAQEEGDGGEGAVVEARRAGDALLVDHPLAAEAVLAGQQHEDDHREAHLLDARSSKRQGMFPGTRFFWNSTVDITLQADLWSNVSNLSKLVQAPQKVLEKYVYIVWIAQLVSPHFRLTRYNSASCDTDCETTPSALKLYQKPDSVDGKFGHAQKGMDQSLRRCVHAHVWHRAHVMV